ncbi:MAG: GAF domain-containing protein, partial [Burkholderiales bacterium]|nr:GAF domain-containing protein [Anaerolineae bacterium]
MSVVTNTGKDSPSTASAEVRTGAASLLNPQQLWLRLMYVEAAVAVIAFIVYFVLALNWYGQAFFGTTVAYTIAVDAGVPTGSVHWPGLDAGLLPGDNILSINGQALAASPTDYSTARQNFHDVMSRLQPGDTVDVEFSRAVGDGASSNIVPASTVSTTVCRPPENGAAQCSAQYTLGSFPTNDFLAFFVVPFVSGLILLAAGIALLYLRPNLAIARLVSLLCFLLAVFCGGIFDVGTSHSPMIVLWLLHFAFVGGTMLTISLLFPAKSPLLYRFPKLVYAPYAVNIPIALAALMLLNPSVPQQHSAAWEIAAYFAMLGLLSIVLSLGRQRTLATSPISRDQNNVVLLGIALSVTPVLVWLINNIVENLRGYQLVTLTIELTTPFLIVLPLSLIYAVLEYRTIDSDRLISRSISYAIMLVALVIGYFLMVFSLSLITGELIGANNPFMIGLMIAVIAALFLPIRTHLQQRIDAIYFRTRRSYQNRSEAFAAELTRLSELEPILSALHKELDETIEPTHTHIFLRQSAGDYAALPIANGKAPTADTTDLRFSADSGVVELLNSSESVVYLESGRPWPIELRSERARLMILQPLALAGLGGSSQLNGFIIIGPPRSGEGRYGYEELRFIDNLTNQIAVAVERAQVVGSLENRVRELDVLSQVGQAVNFTLEFDDLLELINAQTSKLIRADYFYIVLREPANDQLYFAFFLENDERYTDKENRRWDLGSDLFSEVIRTTEPLRVLDFASAMTQRHAKIGAMSESIHAWMGVPLIAGQRTLGIMAVGSTETEKAYADDQMKIFLDISSLAATSLDKARLFAETNLRARQLGALNDVSRRLASELDVEKLLELITNSATDILEAGAGSLLLTVDDDNSGDLEFKVVTGEAGHDLIGVRLPAGRGLVGEVAKRGKHVIVNEAAKDPRWGGEVTKGGFQTDAILAVPLMTKGRVIGVLEVLNRRDGGLFTEDDASLLTTFAGQAAVAIENARLFQMTDFQLTARVSELQTLERIDVELNRSLDLGKVAEITLRWALSQSNATVGALGVVIGEPPVLQIVHAVGYEPEDFPDGAQGMIWPIDRGIVSRVIRTRQPDLVPDVKIDPVYIPSKRGSLSQITVPMLSGGEINAVLILEATRQPRLNLLDLAFVQRLAEHASVSIANAQLYDELTRANNSKSEFVSFVAHELKNPLTSIMGYAD